MNWYLSFKNPKDCKITGDTECNRIEKDGKKQNKFLDKILKIAIIIL